jgi:aryl-alcohol dehydrogenase-like predicted oxidoreductase
MGASATADSPVATIASDLGATPAQTELAWLLHRSAVTAPIPGTSSTAHLEENLAALDLHLTGHQYERLTAAATTSPAR